MPAYHKPSKEDRQKARAEEKQKLENYRKVQSTLARERDNNQCIFCWFLFGLKEPMQEVHHFYGRGKDSSSWQESYTNLGCTCRQHHPPKMLAPGETKSLDWAEAVLKDANETPINPNFVHQKEKKDDL